MRTPGNSHQHSAPSTRGRTPKVEAKVPGRKDDKVKQETLEGAGIASGKLYPSVIFSHAFPLVAMHKVLSFSIVDTPVCCALDTTLSYLRSHVS